MNGQDDDDYDEDDLLDGELRPARRRFSHASRRSSVVSSAIAFGTAAARRVSISPSSLASATASLLTGVGSSSERNSSTTAMTVRSPRTSTSPETSTPERKSSISTTGGPSSYGTGGPSSSSYYREESSV